MAMWPTEEEVREFESENAPWPCMSSPSDRCKCGILATEGVVPSELGYGSFCGNAHGDYWVNVDKKGKGVVVAGDVDDDDDDDELLYEGDSD
uniref:Uncharacterized protein n=1 Tax=Setaria italica TaxID=4555 RepID=K3YYM0_SETIT